MSSTTFPVAMGTKSPSRKSSNFRAGHSSSVPARTASSQVGKSMMGIRGEIFGNPPEDEDEDEGESTIWTYARAARFVGNHDSVPSSRGKAPR
ncbi:unnamed protein product [Tilletia controversa]|nr:unnamed protein product [Tilletia controversa]